MPAPKPSSDPLAQRLIAVREATGLVQVDFVKELNRANRKLFGGGARMYTQSTLSKLEIGWQEPSLDDVAVYAAIDPLKRGKLWVGWGEKR